jgi:hypothetical protein
MLQRYALTISSLLTLKSNVSLRGLVRHEVVPRLSEATREAGDYFHVQAVGE